MIMIAAIWRWLIQDDRPLYLPKTWLRDTHRLALYEAWTKRQWQQGSVVKDTAAMRREAFWQARAAKHAQPWNVAAFQKRVTR